MSANFMENAFNSVLRLQAVDYELIDLDNSVTIDIKAAPSNYFRKLSSLEETTIEGREFVISKAELDAQGYGIPRRGHRLREKNNPTNIETIGQVKEMVILTKVVGYRVRTE